MQTKNQYEPLAQDRYYIDKTEALEKGIAVFPSIYIEGAAASGKTTAVRMLLAKHPEADPVIFWMDEEQEHPSEFAERLRELEGGSAKGQAQNAEKRKWVVFENLTEKIPEEMTAEIIKFLQRMSPENRAILISRDRLAEPFLELLWNRKMEIISQAALLFTREEVFRLADYSGSQPEPERIYEETGGWAGCVDMMLRMSARDIRRSVEELRSSYEINTYIHNTIIGALSAEEQEVLRRAAFCPWINEALCRDVWDIPQSADVMERLARKGLLSYDRDRRKWKIAPLIRKNYQNRILEGKEYQRQAFWKRLSEWYEECGCIKEALECLKESGNVDLYYCCMIKYYDKVPFLDVSYGEIFEQKDNIPQIIYLRGMYAYFQQNGEKFQKEIRRLETVEGEDRVSREIYLNLMYLNLEISLDEWLALLEKLSGSGETFRLYGMLGGSVTFLCGMRDLSGLFACARREENRKARIWKEHLGKQEWTAYQLARIDYYMETERMNSLKEDDKQLIHYFIEESESHNPASGQAPWQIRLAGLYLLSKRQEMEPEAELNESIRKLERSLRGEEIAVCVKNAEAVSNVYTLWRKSSERLARWLRHAEQEHNVEIREDSYYHLCCQAKSYLLLGLYEKADKILRRTIPYLRNNRRSRYLAEVLFQQAMINWEAGKRSQALQNMIESFLINGDSRYVGFYASYGKRGKKVMDAYIQWQSANSPEGWHRKKKYNYGNVLRMPMEDYLEVILRCIRKEARGDQIFPEEIKGEKLTMMETIILQGIGRGLTNAEICEELNVKLPTVKSHIYSLYKKLGANSRVQAVLKGKEKGILD